MQSMTSSAASVFRRIPCWTLALALVLGTAFAAAPASAQTGSTWHNQKMSDMHKHDRESAFDARANEHYQMGLQYMNDIQRLLRDDDRGPKQEKKLDKAYRKAVKNFEQAIKVDEDWMDPYVMLGSIHYKMKDYPAAKSAYESALALDPENPDVQAYLNTVNWYIDHPEEAEGG